MAEGNTINNDSRIVELLELLAKNQMNAQTEQVKQMCAYVGTLENQINSMTEEIKSVRQELVFMKEDTISKHVKDSLKKTADTLQKQCDSIALWFFWSHILWGERLSGEVISSRQSLSHSSPLV